MPAGKLSECALERELFKYLPSSPLLPHNPDLAPVSSQDPTLTGLAQLGVLRLRASRCFISLFNKTHQYIIAEATPTLSLQSDDVYEEGDGLWYGSTVRHRPAGPCSLLVDRHVEAYNEDKTPPESVTVISDLTLEDNMSNTDFMNQSPLPRFYAGVVLESPGGAIIGSYCVLDNQPRESLDPAQLRFLRDMGLTVMSHLANAKVREEYRQGERLIRGIGSFVEGRGSLRNWRAMTGHDGRSYEASRIKYGREGQLDTRQQAIQVEGDSTPQMGIAFHQATAFQQEDDTQSADNRSMPPPTPAIDHRRDSYAAAFQASTLSQSHHVNSAVIESTAAVFSRATNIIRECLEVEGAIFYESRSNDHSVGVSSVRSADPDTESTDAGSEVILSGAEPDLSPGSKGDKLCPVISFSDSHKSSVNEESSTETYMRFPEKFLKSLLRRYSQGDIFHFDNEGNLSSGSSDPDSPGDLTDQTKECLDSPERANKKTKGLKKKRRASRPQDGQDLLKIFPGARSIALIPLWDSHKEKWYAGGFIWTRQANRYFTRHGHLSFLEAIGSIVMTEFARLSALASERAKTDLLGSISHELRSPLHGILGCVELLEDSPQSPFQSEMLQSIEGCGRTLLETIEQLLDFSKINNVATRRKQNKMRHLAFKSTHTSEPGNSATRLDIITEEVVAAVTIGFHAQRKSHSQSGHYHKDDTDFAAGSRQVQDWVKGTNPSSSSRSMPAIILDIDKSMDMAFLTTQGSWRRIVMNLFANALKYTKSGHIRISLTARPARHKHGNKVHHITFTITDTGQGISADYLRDKLFKPFAQENSLASGTGLGLSIVKQIVDTCGGKIKVESVQNKGTKISVSMYAELHESEALHSTEEMKVRELTAVAQRIQGKTACLLDSSKFSTTHEIEDYQDPLEQSLEKMCRNWFGFELCNEAELEHQASDVFLLVESRVERGTLDLSKLALLGSKFNKNAILLVICRSLQSKQRLITTYTRILPTSWSVQYIVQPFGMHKLATALSHALNQQTHNISKGPQVSSEGVYNEPRNSVSAPSLILSPRAEPFTPTVEKRPDNAEYFPTDPAGNETSEARVPQAMIPWQSSLVNPKMTNIEESEDNRPQDPQLVDKATASHDTFLLVDDNPINLKILTAHVKRNKAPFLTAEDGSKALEIYKSDPSKCGIILMDISMPVMDGLESTRAIRAFEKQGGLKPSLIIVVTGLASAHIQNETKLSGADSYLAKPVGLKELDEIILNLKNRTAVDQGGWGTETGD